jgi:uncharacterized protein YukE
LIALIVSLMAIEDTGELDIGGLLARFATALMTTVVGLAARMYLVNLSSTSGEAVEDAERSLAEASQRYGRNLESLSNALIGQAIRIQETSETLMENLENSVAEATQKASSRIEESATAMADALTGIGDNINRALEKNTIATESVAGSIEANQQALDRTRKGLEGISVAVESIEAEITGAAGRMGSLADLLSAVEEVTGHAEAIDDAFARTTVALDEITTHYDAVNASVGRSSDIFRDHVNAMSGAVKSSQNMMLQLSRELTEAATYVREEISRP